MVLVTLVDLIYFQMYHVIKKKQGKATDKEVTLAGTSTNTLEHVTLLLEYKMFLWFVISFPPFAHDGNHEWTSTVLLICLVDLLFTGLVRQSFTGNILQNLPLTLQ